MTVPALSAELTRSPIAASVRPGVRMFRVTHEGSYAGRRFRAGEIVLVEGSPLDGQDVVMVPAGHGHPQLGRVDGVLLLGSYGEPCSNARWRVAGRVCGVARSVGAAWAVRWFDAQQAQVAPVVPGAVPSVAVVPPVQVHDVPATVPMAQLSLFAA